MAKSNNKPMLDLIERAYLAVDELLRVQLKVIAAVNTAQIATLERERLTEKYEGLLDDLAQRLNALRGGT